jgi:excisionase family DNA binding protein
MHATRSPELLRISEAAEKLNVSRASVYRWIEEGRLPAIQLGGRGAPLRIPGDELNEWLDERRTSSDVGDSSGTPRPLNP